MSLRDREETVRDDGCPSDLLFDRLLVGELDGATTKKWTEHFEKCARCVDRLEAQRTAIARFAEEVPLDRLVVETERRLRPRKIWFSPPRLAFALSAAASFLLVVLLPRAEDMRAAGQARDNGTRRKGGLGLAIVAKRLDGRVEQLIPGAASLSPGEAVRFSISTEHEGHAVVLGVDAAKEVTLYAPAQAVSMVSIKEGHDQLLDGSTVLDGALGPERVIALVCTTPVPLRAILTKAKDRLEHAGGDPLRMDRLNLEIDGAECEETTFDFEKVPPP